jgi:hypothetical protein
MQTGIIINAKIGAYKLTRANYFRLIKERRQISLAELHIHDADYTLFKSLKEGDRASIAFGYRDGEQATFAGELLVPPYSIGSDITRLIIAGSENAYSRTFISESYNDETPAAIVRRLSAQAGLAVGELQLPEDPIPHIIFNYVNIWQAFAQLRKMILRNGYQGNLDYWFYQERLYWGVPQARQISVAAGTIIDHTPNYRLDNVIELPLSPSADYSELIHIDDKRRGIDGAFRITSVTHLYQESISRTYIGYVHE